VSEAVSLASTVRWAARTSVLLAAFGLAASCRPAEKKTTGPTAAPAPAASSAEKGARAALPSWVPADDGQWSMPAKDYASSRYSSLNEITPQNVKNLRLAFTFSTGVIRGHEAAPLVVGNTMYVVTPFPNILYALDLTQPGAPMKWSYKPPVVGAAQGVACCDVVNRGAVYANGRIHFNTLDNQTVGIDAKTGRELWRSKVGEINHGESTTMAPLEVQGRVLVGNSGGEFGVRGRLTALEADSGRVAWTGWSTGPDKDVLIGSRFKPFYASERGADLGVHSWPGDMWKIGGGTVWGWISYDPELGLVYYGTANPGPWNSEQRPGDNKWCAGAFARDPKTGEAVWALQWSHHDLFDHDGVNENILLDVPVNGATRRVLLHPDRNGYLYMVDRGNGEILAADPFVYITTSRGVDLKTGRLIPIEEKSPKVGKVVRDICPAAPGAKDWQPAAFSPRTGYLYIPHNNLCEEEEGVEANYIEGTPFVGANVRMYAGPGGNRGWFTAWDVAGRKMVWRLAERFPAWSGALATAGDVVFYGNMEGWFKALDARTGQLLWQFKTGSGIIGQPIAYRGPDGHEYVAILSGVGGWSGAVVAGGLDVRDGTGALGFTNAMKDLPDVTTKGGTLYVFALP
jgi:PQQ-dependent dehydrogenase (methanol/ethanol family)